MNWFEIKDPPDNREDFVKLPINPPGGDENANLVGLIRTGRSIDLEERFFAFVQSLEKEIRANNYVVKCILIPGSEASARFFLEPRPK